MVLVVNNATYHLLHDFYNTPHWITSYKEYALLKHCQRKTEWEKTSSEGKRVQYSCEPLSAFRLPH